MSGRESRLSVVDYNDLNLVYLSTVGTWSYGWEAKHRLINNSNLPTPKKEYLNSLLEEIHQKAIDGKYSNEIEKGPTMGLFGTGFNSFKGKADNDSVRKFLEMCIDIIDMDDDERIFKRVEELFAKGFKGMGSAAASMILHCLKPHVFPIINGNRGLKKFLEELDIKLSRPEKVETYIDNCRILKKFRDENLPFRNYRILDWAAWEYGEERVFTEVIRKYKEDFKNRDKEERYKWEAVKCFQDNWDIDAEDFGDMVERALAKSGNLLASGYNYARTAIVEYSKEEPEYIKELFIKLFDESNDVMARIENFIKDCDPLFEKYKGEKDKNHWQTQNSVSIYLFFRYPEKYYIYQYGKLKGFVENTDWDVEYKTGDIQNIRKYFEICDAMLEEVLEDEELLRMSRERLDDNCYDDPEYHLLADDAVYFTGKKYKPDNDVYWPSLEEYNPDISVDKWIELIQDKKVFTEKAKTVIQRFYDIGGKSTCTQLSQKYDETKNYYSKNSSALAQRVYEATGCPVLRDKEGEVQRWWPVLFVGKNANPDEEGSWIWKLRDELYDAVEQLYPIMEVKTMSELNKNLIFYGPPGTGKTYHTVNYAVAIIENRDVDEIIAEGDDAVLERYNKYKSQGLVEFTTFHQSFGYEEFVEGIRPVMQSAEEDESKIDYQIVDGVFKKFCEKAAKPIIIEHKDYGFNKNPNIWKVSLAGTGDNPIRSDCLKNGYIRIGWDEYGPAITDETEFEKGGKSVLNAFINKMQKGDIVLSCYSERTIDAIGVVTGEYQWREDLGDFMRTRNVNWLAKKEAGEDYLYDIYEMNNEKVMTLATVYELKIPLSDVLKILKEKSAETQVTEEEPENHVFIIDEINRGNISKIFGELITLIEPSKRTGQPEAKKATLPYSGEPFGVPDNVYIIGTMNTADRSIALMDTALRRRFDFIEMMPEPSLLEDIYVEGVSIEKLLEKLNRRIEVLHDREHTLGHSYFWELKKDNSIEKLGYIFKNKVIPLLQEYFFEDYEKIRMVLGDTRKEDESTQFIQKFNYAEDFNGEVDGFIDTNVYRVNDEAFLNIEAYRKI